MRVVREDVVDAVCRELKKAGDPDRAVGQQAYMKSTMPFRGVGAPQLRATLRPLLDDPAYRLNGRGEWEATIRGLWDIARFREERYAALAISGHRLYRQWAADPSAMALYHYLVESGGLVGLLGPDRLTSGGPGPETAPRDGVRPDARLGG